MVYIMYSNQYVDLLKNGPDNSTVIVSRGWALCSNGETCSKFWLKDGVVVIVNTQEPYTISLYKDNKVIMKNVPITREFGMGWLDISDRFDEFEYSMF